MRTGFAPPGPSPQIHATSIACRVYPELYLDVKESLVAESEKCGGLRLAEARRVVKIDVNKTRKLYDFFLAQQLVRKPSTTSQ